MKHVWYKSGDGHSCNDMGECMVCSVSTCKVCHGMEGSLTTHCCGEIIPYDKDQRVYSGKLDYREGEGWVNKFGPHMQWSFYSAILAEQRGKSKYSSTNELILAYGATKEEYKEIKSKVLKDVYA